VPPLGVHDVEGAVVDVLALLLQSHDDPARGRFTFHTVARARATKIKKTPGPTTFLARYSSAIRCLRSPALPSITGTPFAPAQARTRRAKRPASRIRCASSSPSSESPCHRRHQVRNPPGLCPSG
jgi:hypothetical protein